jgi:hypothetical protein
MSLICRWAIEDPNPGEVRREAERIEKLGKEAIRGMMDEGIVEAAQTIRALEDGDEEDFYPIDPSEEQEEERAPKRIKADADAPGGLLSGEAMENLKFYADIARQQAERKRKIPVVKKQAPKPVVKPATGGLAGLGSYDSDSD